MISLADLADVHQRYADALAHPVAPVEIRSPRGPVVVGDRAHVVMGCVNLSGDSWYRESVAVDTEAALRLGRTLAARGAQVVDVGAEASWLGAERVDVPQQVGRLLDVVKELAGEMAVSVETYHPEVAAACLEAGATVLNLTGREHEDELLHLAAEHDAAVVMCFGERCDVRDEQSSTPTGDPLPALVSHFAPRLDHARDLGVDRVVVDPGLGFYYANLTDMLERARHQSRVLVQTFRLRELGVPVCHAMPVTFDIFGEEYHHAEGFYAALAALGGTHLLRVHEVGQVRAVLRALGTLEAH